MNSPRFTSWFEFRQRYLPFAVFALVLGATAVLWNKHAGRSTIVGQAEAVHAIVSAAKPGTVIALKTDLLQRVKRGDIVAQIVPADLDAVCADLASKVETLRAQLAQRSDGNSVNYQQLRLTWLQRNVDLASARVDWQLADADYQRYLPLHQKKLITDEEFDAKRANRDALQDKVNNLVKLVADLDTQIAHMAPAVKSDDPATSAISAAMVAQQKQLEALAEASNLKAPMDGIVSTIQKRAGEIVKPGDPVMILGALRPTRIVAYVRQPLDGHVKPGDLVEVSTRGNDRVRARARVLEVGTQLEAIDPTLLPPTNFSAHVAEYGLPLLVEMPANLPVAPGEVVTLAASFPN